MIKTRIFDTKEQAEGSACGNDDPMKSIMDEAFQEAYQEHIQYCLHEFWQEQRMEGFWEGEGFWA
jgi:hypothetical protein